MNKIIRLKAPFQLLSVAVSGQDATGYGLWHSIWTAWLINEPCSGVAHALASAVEAVTTVPYLTGRYHYAHSW